MRRKLALLSIVLLASCESKEPVGNVDPGEVVAESDAIAFGAVLMGGEVTSVVRFQNRGRVTGELQVTTAEPFTVASVEPRRLAPGEVAVVSVVFTPEEEGAAEGTLQASISGVGDPVQVQLSGEGTRPAIRSQEPVSFGDVELGTTAHAKAKIESLSAAPLILQIGLAGTGAGAFAVPIRTVRLPARETAEIDVAFSPGTDDTAFASLQVKACESCPAETVPLSGRGVGPSTTASPLKVDFGHVRPGRTSREVVTVRKEGSVAAWLTGVELVAGVGSPFAVEAPAVPAEIADSVEIPLTFAPATATASTAVLRLLAGGQIHEIALEGDGGDGDISLFPPVLDFGWVPAGSTTLQVAISDTGTGIPSDITKVSVEGGAGAFVAAPTRPLPTTARGSDLRVDVQLSATPGSYTAELVVEIEGQPPRRLPLMATVVAGGFCDLVVEPVMRMGLVTVGRGLERALRIRNDATSDCVVGEVEIAGSPSFSLPGVSKGRLYLVRARNVEQIPVRFDPTTAGLLSETATVTMRKTDPDQPYTSVQVSGQGTGIDLSIAPGEVLFPAAPVGSEQLIAADVKNGGRIPVEISATIAGSSALSLEVAPPAFVAGQSSATAVVRFRPTDIVRAAAELLLFTPLASEPWVLPVTGQVTSDACGAQCTRPVVACPADRSVFLEGRASLAGATRHAAGTPVTCTWSVKSAPGGSTAAPSSGCAASFQPDVAGSYELELAATDGTSSATCSTRLTAATAGGLWVDALPDVTNDDVDLHLFDDGAGDLALAGSWRSSTSDCWRRRPAPDWGEEAASPVYQAGGAGRAEVVRIAQPETGASYRVGIHWPSTRSGNGSLTVETSIWCGGQQAAKVSTTLDQAYQAAEVGTVTFTGAGTCNFTPSSTRVVVLP